MKFKNALLALMAAVVAPSFVGFSYVGETQGTARAVELAEAILAEVSKRTGEKWEDPEVFRVPQPCRPGLHGDLPWIKLLALHRKGYE
jgi:hypothetical protein